MSNPEILDFIRDIDPGISIKSMLLDDLGRADALPADDLGNLIREKYGVDLSAEYARIPLGHPFGKAAGQLSIAPAHVLSDRKNGLSFTVLKSAVGVTEDGKVGIGAWEKPSPKMVLEQRESRDGRMGWTVTWKGRGWVKGFDAYVDFFRESLERNPGYLIIPSLMVDVTDPDRAVEQAVYCLGKLMEIQSASQPDTGFLIEIDISPTLSLLPGSAIDEKYKEWVRTSVAAFREGLKNGGKCIVKIPNAGRGGEFQLSLIELSLSEGGDSIAGMIVGNRLFDRLAVFEGQEGIAYGGYDLSDANLETLNRLIGSGFEINLIGTGNICTGKMMAEYAVRGCMAGEIHTFFQLPPSAYRAPKEGGRTWRAIRELIFHPDDGLISVLLRLEKSGKIYRSDGLIRFMDLPDVYSAVTGEK